MSHVELVQSLYQSFRDDDRARAADILAPDVTWVQMQGFPGGGTRRGVDEVWAGVIEGLRDLWGAWRGEFHEYLDAGDRVIVLGAYVATPPGSDREVRAPFAHVHTIVNGRIARFEQYTDTRILAEALMTRPNEAREIHHE